MKAVLLDIDGTLITLEGIVKGVKETCRKMKIRILTRDEILYKMIGYRIDESFAKMYPKQPERVKEFVKIYKKVYVKNKKLIKSLPYVDSTFKKIRKKGFNIGIVTTKGKSTAMVAFRKCKISDYDVLVTEDDVKKRKPDPEPVFKACKKLKIKPRDCYFVGDHRFDMIAAKKAGCYPIGVLTGVGKRNELKKFGAKKVIKDLKGLIKLLNLR